MEIRLPKNETLTIYGNPRGVAVCCSRGVVWFTQSGDNRDHFLKAGEMVCFSHGGTVVLEGHEDALITIGRAEPSRMPHTHQSGKGIRLVFQGSGR